MNLKHWFTASAVSCLMVGCASTNTTGGSVESPTGVPQKSEMAAVGQPPAKIQMKDVPPLVTQIPDNLVLPANENATSVIKSGKNDDGVWVEGRGIFKGTLDDVYADLLDPLIIGPVHMTQDITLADMNKTDVFATYKMNVKMKYIFSIEFTLDARVEALYDGDVQTGWKYFSYKLDGTRFISKIDTRLTIRDIGNGMYSVEFQSLNEATMDKEDEARQHLETLFNYWTKISDARSLP